MNKHDDDLLKTILQTKNFAQDNPTFKKRLREILETQNKILSAADLDQVSAAGDLDALKNNAPGDGGEG